MHWPIRNDIILVGRKTAYEPLVELHKIFLLPLLIKLGLMKCFIKAIDKK